MDPTVDPLPVPTSDIVAGDVLRGGDITLTGMAVDDIGIVRVRVGIKNRDTGGWTRFDAVLEDFGSSSTRWSLETELRDGRYALSVRAFDVQGYSQPIMPWVKFEVDTSS